MILIEKTEVTGFEQAIRGMRNPMNSWGRSDSGICTRDDGGINCCDCVMVDCDRFFRDGLFKVGKKDYALMLKLSRSGPVHAKYRRMINVYVDITAPLYWWKEFDTYKVGTVVNSCSTMHKIQDKEFTLDDFSDDYLTIQSEEVLLGLIKHLNAYRVMFLNTNTDVDLNYTALSDEACVRMKKDIWWQMIQLLPSSYNQKRTVMLSYEVLAGIYKHRRNHKLDEWVHLCQWIERLPYSEIITNKFEEDNKWIME